MKEENKDNIGRTIHDWDARVVFIKDVGAMCFYYYIFIRKAVLYDSVHIWYMDMMEGSAQRMIKDFMESCGWIPAKSDREVRPDGKYITKVEMRRKKK